VKPVLGIDFGTSNTSAAWTDDEGRVRAVPMRDDGSTSMPTVVWYDGKGNFLAGQSAQEMALADPENTIYSFKRFLGRRYESDFVNRLKDRVPYRIVAAPDGGVAVESHGRVRPIAETTFHVISRVLELAQAHLHASSFEECVLTVPAHATFRQRRALRQAAEMAGLDVKAILNEPTAAALFAQRATGPEETVLVFDLGGGTFDCTLLTSMRGRMKVIATSGDAELGGVDFDNKIVDLLIAKYHEKTGLDIRCDSVVMQRLAFAAERAKIQLSTELSAHIAVRCIAGTAGGGFMSLERELMRSELETAVSGLIERALGLCDEMVERAHKKREDVGTLLFVGGATRMPAVRQRLMGAFQLDANRQPDPDLAVASGAALFGKWLHMMTDVAPMSIGFMMPGGASQEIMAPSSVVPCVRKVPLTRPTEGPLVIAVYEAVSSTSTEREMLGSAQVDPQWLQIHPGPLVLEARMNGEYELELWASAEDGARIAVKLNPLGAR
jgi:molecular chaperone DnaK